MPTALDRLSRDVAALQRQIDALSTPQLDLASVELSSGEEMSLVEGLETASQIAADMADVVERLTSAEGALDGIVSTTFSDTAPSDPSLDDLWWNTATGIPSRYDGSEWVEVRDQGVIDALEAAAAAEAAVDGKITTFYTATAPATGMAEGDLWIKTPDNLQHRYTSGVWVALRAGSDAIEDGAVGGEKLTVDALYGKRIVAAEVMSRESGQRWELMGPEDGENWKPTTLRCYSGNPYEVAPGGLRIASEEASGGAFTLHLTSPQARKLAVNEPLTYGHLRLYGETDGDFGSPSGARLFAQHVDIEGVMDAGLASRKWVEGMGLDQAFVNTLTGYDYSGTPTGSPAVNVGALAADTPYGYGPSVTLLDDGNGVAKKASVDLSTAGGVQVETTDQPIRLKQAGTFGSRVEVTTAGAALASGGETLRVQSDGALRFSGATAWFQNAIAILGSTASNAQKYLSIQRLNNQGGGDGAAYEARTYLGSSAKSNWTTALRKGGAEVARLEVGEDGSKISSPLTIIDRTWTNVPAAAYGSGWTAYAGLAGYPGGVRWRRTHDNSIKVQFSLKTAAAAGTHPIILNANHGMPVPEMHSWGMGRALVGSQHKVLPVVFLVDGRIQTLNSSSETYAVLSGELLVTLD